MLEAVECKAQSQYNEKHDLKLFTISSARIVTEPKIQYKLPNKYNYPLKVTSKLTIQSEQISRLNNKP